MEQKKIKAAFSNAKRDILFLKKELENVEARFSSLLRDQVGSLQTTTRELKTLAEDNSHRLSHLKNRDVVIKKESLPEEFLNEFLEVKQRLSSLESSTSNQPQPTQEKEFGEIVELLQEKIDMELASFKMEISQNLASFEQAHSAKESPQNNSVEEQDQKIQRSFEEFSELLDEKVSMELNGLRMEMTEEIGKLYDTCFNEIVELKKELQSYKKATTNSSQNTKKATSASKTTSQSSSTKKKSTPKKQKSSHLKKVANWFLEDDEEEDLKDIKKEVDKK